MSQSWVIVLIHIVRRRASEYNSRREVGRLLTVWWVARKVLEWRPGLAGGEYLAMHGPGRD